MTGVMRNPEIERALHPADWDSLETQLATARYCRELMINAGISSLVIKVNAERIRYLEELLKELERHEPQ